MSENPNDVTYYDPYIEEYVKKGKSPICGRVSISLLLCALVLWVIMGFKSATSDVITAATATLSLFPIMILFFIGALTLAIVSFVRKERKTCVFIAFGGLIMCLGCYIVKIIMM